MRVHVADHPLVSHKLTVLRDASTDSPTFRRLADELVTLLAYEATRDVRVETVAVMTPVAEAQGVRLADPRPLVVPILRAGLGMLEGMQRLLPTAEVGFLGMVRNEETLEADTSAERLPDDLSGRQCYVLDPMLATGGSLAAAIQFLVDRGADHITAVCLLAAPEGGARIEREMEEIGVPVNLVVAGLDERLDENGYIVPGLGDAGGFAEVEFGGAAGLDRAEVAGARADVAEDHDGGGAAGPALAEVGALRALADGVELVFVHERADGVVAGAAGKFGAEPGRFTRGVHRESSEGRRKGFCPRMHATGREFHRRRGRRARGFGIPRR